MIIDTLVIGAGLAGLAAAERLRAAGREVLVLEKSRGVGGRAVTRRWEGLAVDHGAQFFTTRSEEFRRQTAFWQADGICHPWTNGFHQYQNGRLQEPMEEGHIRFACRDGMSSLGRAIAEVGCFPMEREARVTSIVCEAGHWEIGVEEGRTFGSRQLVLTTPPPQGADLLGAAAPHAAEILRSFQLQPCLALATRYPRMDLDWRGIQSDDSRISWIGHDSSKRPEFHAEKTVIVIHASPNFSRVHFDAEEEKIRGLMLAAASEISGRDLFPAESSFLQRWRYATTSEHVAGSKAVLLEAPAALVLAGESFGGGKVEGAWLSGVHAASLLGAI